MMALEEYGCCYSIDVANATLKDQGSHFISLPVQFPQRSNQLQILNWFRFPNVPIFHEMVEI